MHLESTSHLSLKTILSTKSVVVLQSLESLGIEVILGERLDTSSADKYNEAGQRVVNTLSGRDIATDLMVISSFTSVH